jgi:hypothetical protein
MIFKLKMSVAAAPQGPERHDARPCGTGFAGPIGLLAVSGLLAMLAGCGQKGALVLPAASPAASAAVAK